MYRCWQGRNILSKKGREYKKTCAGLLEKEKIIFPTERLKLTVKLYAPNRRKYDISNRIKAVEDELIGRLITDDEQIDDERIVRCELDPQKEGFALLELEAIEPEIQIQGCGRTGAISSSQD